MTSHRVPTLIGALLATGLCLGFIPQAHSDSGDQSFLDLHRDLVPEGPDTLTDQIVSLADQLGVVTDDEGLTLLPPGTLCEKVDLEGGRLRVFLRLPARLGPDVLSVFDIETAHQIFRHRFAEEAQLTEIRLLARQGDGESWRPLDAWAPEFPPVESTDSRADIRERRVAFRLAKNFDKLPANMRNELIKNLAKVTDIKVREDVVLAVASNFHKLPSEIQQLLYNLASDASPRIREEVAFELGRNFDSISRKAREDLLRQLAKDDSDNVRLEVASTIVARLNRPERRRI